MAFRVEQPISSKEYSSLAVLFIKDFSKWYALVGGMTLLLMVWTVRRVLLIFARGEAMCLRQGDTPICDPFV